MGDFVGTRGQARGVRPDANGIMTFDMGGAHFTGTGVAPLPETGTEGYMVGISAYDSAAPEPPNHAEALAGIQARAASLGLNWWQIIQDGFAIMAAMQTLQTDPRFKGANGIAVQVTNQQSGAVEIVPVPEVTLTF